MKKNIISILIIVLVVGISQIIVFEIDNEFLNNYTITIGFLIGWWGSMIYDYYNKKQ